MLQKSQIPEITYITEALSFSCVLDLLEYSNSTVQLNIRRHYLREHEIDAIERVHPTASVRIVEIDDSRRIPSVFTEEKKM